MVRIENHLGALQIVRRTNSDQDRLLGGRLEFQEKQFSFAGNQAKVIRRSITIKPLQTGLEKWTGREFIENGPRSLILRCAPLAHPWITCVFEPLIIVLYFDAMIFIRYRLFGCCRSAGAAGQGKQEKG